MRILHTAIGASCAGNADLFFSNCWALKRARPLLSRNCRAIFAIDRELTIINYTAAGVRFEVFIDPSYRAPEQTVLHSCIEVDDQADFLRKCAANGLKVSRTPKEIPLFPLFRISTAISTKSSRQQEKARG